METKRITRALPSHGSMQRAVKAALAVGAVVSMNLDGDALFVQFKDSDRYLFDPDNITMHCLELVGVARTHGFLLCRYDPNDKEHPYKWSRAPLVVRTIFSNIDVRVQIGASKWFNVEHHDTAFALRHSIINAFVTYYDEAIAPYPEA